MYKVHQRHPVNKLLKTFGRVGNYWQIYTKCRLSWHGGQLFKMLEEKKGCSRNTRSHRHAKAMRFKWILLSTEFVHWCEIHLVKTCWITGSLLLVDTGSQFIPCECKLDHRYSPVGGDCITYREILVQWKRPCHKLTALKRICWEWWTAEWHYQTTLTPVCRPTNPLMVVLAGRIQMKKMETCWS